MEEGEIKALVEEIRDQRLFDDDRITAFLTSKALDSSDKTRLFKEMAGDHTFDRNFVQHHILEVLSDSDEFVDLLLVLADKIAYSSLARLEQVYSNSPELAMSIYQKLCKIGGPRIPAPAAYILTGIVKNDQEKFFQTTDLLSRDQYVVCAQVEALRIVSSTHKIPKPLIDKIISEIDNSNDTIRFAALRFLLQANIDDSDASRKLADFAKSASSDVKRYMASHSYILCKNKSDLALDVLTLLSDSDDPVLLNKVAQSLGSIASKYPVECLRIIRKWSSQDRLRNKMGLSWMPEQIGKGDAQRVEGFLLKWIEEEKNVLVVMFDLPTLLRDIYLKNDKNKLIDLLGKIDLRDDKRLVILTKALEMVLSEEYNKHPRNQDFIDRSYDFVCAIAQSRGIAPAVIEPRLNDKLMRALAIVDSFDKPQRKVDFNVVRSNLKYCPNVMSLLGQRWFDDKINAQDSSHPLISLLSLPEPDMEKVRRLADEFTKSKGDRMRQASLTHSLAWELEPLATIEHIDRAVAHILKDKNPKTSRLKSGIDNPDEYYPTVGELLISAHFKAVWPTDIQYKVGERPVDCMVNVDGTEILVEVISLDMPVELKYVRTVIGLANRAREKIEEKLEKQIPAMAKVSDRPIFLAMNRTRGLDIDEIMVTDALYGTMQFTFVVNKEKKGEPAGGYPSRANDSISLTEEGRQISGIILFKTDFDLADCKVKLYGDIYRNVNSDRPVSNDLIEKMKAALFNRTLA